MDGRKKRGNEMGKKRARQKEVTKEKKERKRNGN
jgi:hypothetical protein